MEEFVKLLEEKIQNIVETAVDTALSNYGVLTDVAELDEKLDDIQRVVENTESKFNSFIENFERAFRR